MNNIRLNIHEMSSPKKYRLRIHLFYHLQIGIWFVELSKNNEIEITFEAICKYLANKRRTHKKNNENTEATNSPLPLIQILYANIGQ